MALWSAAGATAANATIFTVAGTADGQGACSAPSAAGVSSCTTLRAAVTAANGQTNPPTIQLEAGTYQLTAVAGGQLTLNGSMTITGVGAGGQSGTTIQQTDGVDRVLYVGAPSPSTTVRLSRLEITGGHLKPSWAAGAGSSGGGIDDLAILTLDHVRVTRNEAIGALAPDGMDGDYATGGGVSISGPPGSRISDSVFSHDEAFGGDGGFSASATAGAGVAGSGGAIAYSGSGPLVVTRTTITGNKAAGGTGGPTSKGTPGAGGNGMGGGIFGSGPVAVVGSTVTKNVAVGGVGATGARSGGGLGGGIDVEQAPAVAVDSTVFANQAQAGGPGGSGDGGGIRAGGASAGLSLASDTIDRNQSTGAGGNLTAAVGSAFLIEDTIVASGSPTNCDFSQTTVPLAENHNLEDDAARGCQFTAGNHDLVGAGAQLTATLGANGGPTDTLLPAPGSPVIGAGGVCLDPTTGQALAVDQRGLPRGNPCDIGAVEPQRPANRSLPTVTGTPVRGASLACSLGTWTGDGSLAFARQWLREGVPIAGATSAGYRVALADAGRKLACRVTSTHFGSTSASSTTVAVAPAVVVKRIRGARGAAKVALACIGIARESCRGKLKLFLKSHLTLASVRYSVAAGRSRKLTIKLSGRGRRLLARSGRLHVKLVVVQRVGRINYVVGAKKLTIRAARTHS